MEYWAGLLGGIAAAAAFWLLDRYFLTLSPPYQIGGAIVCFFLFGGTGFWLFPRAPKSRVAPPGTRVASGLKGKNIKVTVDGVTTTGSGRVNILTDVDAKGDVTATAKKIDTKS
jgi:hypothetical protein